MFAAKVTVAELPFVPNAPPFAAVQAESTKIEPPNVSVGPPEIRSDGQPRRAFGQLLFEGSRSTTEYDEPEICPFSAVDVVATVVPP